MKNYFAENLKALRQYQNLLQKELAGSLGVSKSTISGWEIGRNQPDYDMLILVAEIFNVTLDDLIKQKL